jgi:hypothetical protein
LLRIHEALRKGYSAYKKVEEPARFARFCEHQRKAARFWLFNERENFLYPAIRPRTKPAPEHTIASIALVLEGANPLDAVLAASYLTKSEVRRLLEIERMPLHFYR